MKIPYLSHLSKILLDLLFPIKCLNCRQPKTYLCPTCLSEIKITQSIIYSTTTIPDLTTQGLKGVIATTDYQSSKILQKAIHLFKYKCIKDIGRLLGLLMQKRINIFLKNNPDEWIVIPIPLHRRKELERGFNQNDILTTTCFDSHLTILIGKSNPLKRTKYTQSQTQFKGAERVANIKQSFKVIDESKVKNKNIILVDDVLTTGATLREAALTLCQVGARQVWGFVLAKD